MNILGMNSTVRAFFSKDSKQVGKKLDLTSKDTISFSGNVSMNKKISEFKALKSEEFARQDINDVIKIMDFFGYKQTKDFPNHLYTGPYGQTINLGNGKKMTQAFVGKFVEALNRADDFNGELIFLDHPMSEEESAEWKHRLETRKPNENQVNKYALDLVKQKDSNTSVEVDDVKDEDDRVKNEQRWVLSDSFSAINEEQKNADAIVNRFEKLKKEIESLPFDKEVATIEKELEDKQKELAEKSNKLHYYKTKVDNGFLEYDELDEAQEFGETKVSFEEVVKKIDDLELKAISAMEHKSCIRKDLAGLIEKTTAHIKDIEDIIEITKEVLNEYKIYPNLRVSVAAANKRLQEIEEAFEKTSKYVSNHKRMDREKASDEQVMTVIGKLNDVNAIELDAIDKKLEEINSIIKSEMQIDQSDFDRLKAKRREAAFKKFGGNKYNSEASSMDQVPVEEKPSTVVDVPSEKTDVVKDDVVNATDVVDAGDDVEIPSVVEEQPLTTEKVDVVEDETNIDTKGVNDTQPVVEMPTTEVVSPITANTDSVDFSSIKSDLASNLALLPLPNVVNAYENILDKEFKESSFAGIANDEQTISNHLQQVLSKVVKTIEYERANNALRFALLDSVYKNSKDKNGEIYSLTPQETISLIDKIKKGEKEFSIATKTSELKISLEKDIDFDEINETFANYNEDIQKMGEEEATPIIDAASKYAPQLSENETTVLFYTLSREGSYIKSLSDTSADPSLKAELLKKVWTSFDARTKNNYTEEIIKKYWEDQSSSDEQKLQERKKASIDSIDWTVF